MIINILLLLIGFIILVKGADFLLDGATSLAKKLSVSEIAIGLTIVAFGTSSPELVVNILSSINNHPELCFGNVLGSNIFNILIVLGISGLIYPIAVQKNTVKKEIPFVFFGSLLLLGLANNFGFSGNRLSRIDGLILLLSLFIFFYYVLGISKEKSGTNYNIIVYSNFKTSIYIILGILGLFLGGEIVVRNAVKIARALNVSEKLIALTVIALGTSLPELVTSVIAVTRKRYDLAIGNVIGSNIFNMFMVLGVTAVINPVQYNVTLNSDMLLMIAITLVFFITMFTGKKRQLDRLEAFLFILIYLAYLVFIIKRQ
ncbi:MAG: sodium:proton exchanger [Candidatus Cloacimonas sp. SDB]|nr:MAG: sodium:proton exchanger [Candidatus Cloacimonas sp. SDB]